MGTDELSPEQEEQLIGQMLRERSGIDPGRLRPVIDFVMVLESYVRGSMSRYPS